LVFVQLFQHNGNCHVKNIDGGTLAIDFKAMQYADIFVLHQMYQTAHSNRLYQTV